MFCFFVPLKIKLLIQHLSTNEFSQSHKLEEFFFTTWEISLLCAHKEEDPQRYNGRITEHQQLVTPYVDFKTTCLQYLRSEVLMVMFNLRNKHYGTPYD